MDADGLPLVGPGINLEQVEPIAPKRMLAFLNHFIIHTVGFLNRFSVACEEKLENLTVRIQRLETTVTILETKLQSIPGLDDITAATLGVQPAPISSTPSVTNGVAETPAIPTTTVTNTPASVQEPIAQVAADNTGAATPDTSAAKKASDDPRYSKFFKLLSMRIPKEALQQRMAIEGLDPSVLDNPDAVIPAADVSADAPAPPAGDSADSRKKQKRDSDHDFSDDDDDDDRLSTSSSHASSSDFS